MGIMANPFYLDMGYTKTEIANVAKVFGFLYEHRGFLLCGCAGGEMGSDEAAIDWGDRPLR